MPMHPSPAGAAARTSGPVRRRPQLQPAERLAQLSASLDTLIRDVGIGPHSHREHERQVGEAEAIAAGIRAVFREPTPPAPVNPPIWQRGRKAAW